MEEYLSFRPEPSVFPSSRAAHVLVVGGGVTGLITSWVLLDQGYRVTALSSGHPSRKSNALHPRSPALYGSSRRPSVASTPTPSRCIIPSGGV